MHLGSQHCPTCRREKVFGDEDPSPWRWLWEGGEHPCSEVGAGCWAGDLKNCEMESCAFKCALEQV